MEGLAESREQGACPECGKPYTAGTLAYSECPSDLRVSLLMVWPLGISVLGALTAIFRPNAAVVALGGVAVWMIVTPVVAQLMLRKHVPPMLRPAGFIRQAKHFGMLTRLVVSLYVGVIWLAVLSAVALLGTLLVGGLRTLI